MYIKTLELANFRAFSEPGKTYRFDLGRHITCISGHNGIGKSTILAVLSNCGELKASVGRHLNNDIFRGEYSQLIKGEREFDKTGYIAKFTFEPSNSEENMDDVPPSGLRFRATFQEYTIKNEKYIQLSEAENKFEKIFEKKTVPRYRLIPMKSEEKHDERKLSWPTYYLGLSRLFPVGESNEVKQKKV